MWYAWADGSLQPLWWRRTSLSWLHCRGKDPPGDQEGPPRERGWGEWIPRRQGGVHSVQPPIEGQVGRHPPSWDRGLRAGHGDQALWGGGGQGSTFELLMNEIPGKGRLGPNGSGELSDDGMATVAWLHVGAGAFGWALDGVIHPSFGMAWDDSSSRWPHARLAWMLWRGFKVRYKKKSGSFHCSHAHVLIWVFSWLFQKKMDMRMPEVFFPCLGSAPPPFSLHAACVIVCMHRDLRCSVIRSHEVWISIFSQSCRMSWVVMTSHEWSSHICVLPVRWKPQSCPNCGMLCGRATRKAWPRVWLAMASDPLMTSFVIWMSWWAMASNNGSWRPSLLLRPPSWRRRLSERVSCPLPRKEGPTPWRLQPPTTGRSPSRLWTSTCCHGPRTHPWSPGCGHTKQSAQHGKCPLGRSLPPTSDAWRLLSKWVATGVLGSTSLRSRPTRWGTCGLCFWTGDFIYTPPATERIKPWPFQPCDPLRPCQL